MKKVLFRAKRIDNKQWIEGYYSPVNLPLGNMGYFINEDGFKAIEVDPDTVGQYSCMNDKKDRAIFEGDIVKVHDYTIRRDSPWHEFVGVVGFKDGSYVIKTDMFTHYRWIDYEVEVIGNIYDNKDLIERYELKNVIN